MRYINWGLAALVVAGVAWWQPTVLGFASALGGLLLELAALQLGLLLGATLSGVRVTHVIIGVGGTHKQWTSARRRIVLRRLPILLTVGIAGERTPVRARTVAAGVTAAVVATGTAAACWLTPNAGLGLAATATLLAQLIPSRTPGNSTLGWFLFGLPLLTGRPLAEMEAMPRITRAMDAFNAGDLDTAERISAELTDDYPELLTVIGLGIAVLCGRNRYGDALHRVSGLVGRPDLQPRELAFVMASMAGLTAHAVDAGQLPEDIGVPTARRAIEGAIQIGYPAHRANGTLGLIHLLEGDHAQAAELAERGAESSEQAVDRADDLTTAAKAHMAAGDNKQARKLVDEAHELAGWYPRVAATRARLTIS